MRRHEEDDEALEQQSFTPRDLLESRRSIPPLAYALLAAAILAVSSAAVAFKLLESDVEPITAAAWRLQATSLILLPMFAFQYRTCDASVRGQWWKGQTWGLMVASGACLSAHFSTWVWGLSRTSLPHALLFVTSTPLIIAVGCIVLKQPITKVEIASTIIGFFGMILCEVAASTSKERATLLGDFFSFLGAISIIGYLHVGRSLRSWMPIFMYALPVTAVSALLTSILSMVTEGAALFKRGPEGVFGYFDIHHMRDFCLVLFLACGPGLVGHTGFNTLLRFFSPLVISMAFPLEPVVGSMLGALAGVAHPPGVLDWIGGTIMVSAFVGCTYAQGRTQASHEKRKAINVATSAALADDGLVEMAAFSIVEYEDDIDLNES